MNLIIAGVHKAGTTSLYTYLSWHPEVCGSEVKETHFFSDSRFKKKHKTYKDYFSSCEEMKIHLEASPEYLYGGKETALRIKNGLKNVNLIFILRNPAEKILSSFRHRKKKLVFSEDYSMHDFANDFLQIKSLDEITSNSHKYTQELLEGSYIDYLPEWYEVFNENQIKVVFFDELKENPKEIVSKLCDWISIGSQFYENKTFTVENKSVLYRSKILQKASYAFLERFEPFFRKNYKLKNLLRKIYFSINSKEGANQYSDYEHLNKIYFQKNQSLKEFLIEKGYSNFPVWM